MARVLSITVKESIDELQEYYNKASCTTIKKRIEMLMIMKKHEPKMLSKDKLATLCNCAPKSAHDWRHIYMTGGIEEIIRHNWKGGISTHITKEQHEVIERKLNDPNNGLVGYKDLLNWVETSFGISIKYKTLYEYVKRNFKTRIKISRKKVR